jgi:hypothetical protein
MSLALMILAVARVTRLVTTDVLFDTPRNRVLTLLIKAGPALALREKIAYLIVCDWCSSVYVGAAGSAAWYAWGESMTFMAVCAALAASYVTGFLASVTERGE